MPAKDKIQLSRAKAMRTEQTPPEQELWYQLRAKRLNGVKFSRQVLVGPYIVDFAARTEHLVIELDGDSHGHQVAYDERRTLFLENQGYRVIRFTNAEVLGNMEGVLQMIVAALDAAPLPSPLPKGEREE